jgi:hypothetical protein
MIKKKGFTKSLHKAKVSRKWGTGTHIFSRGKYWMRIQINSLQNSSDFLHRKHFNSLIKSLLATKRKEGVSKKDGI